MGKTLLLIWLKTWISKKIIPVFLLSNVISGFSYTNLYYAAGLCASEDHCLGKTLICLVNPECASLLEANQDYSDLVYNYNDDDRPSYCLEDNIEVIDDLYKMLESCIRRWLKFNS